MRYCLLCTVLPSRQERGESSCPSNVLTVCVQDQRSCGPSRLRMYFPWELLHTRNGCSEAISNPMVIITEVLVVDLSNDGVILVLGKSQLEKYHIL